MRAFGAVVLLALQGACASGAMPRQPIVTDRPRFTQNPATVPARTVQVEGGVAVQRGSFHSALSGRVPYRGFDAGAVVRAGVTSRAEVRVGLPNYTTSEVAGQRREGLVDASVSGKVRLLAPGAEASPLMPDASLSAWLILPTGSRELRGEGVRPLTALDLAWDLTPRLVLGADVTYVRARVEDRGVDQLAGGLALTGRLSRALELYGEVVQWKVRLPGSHTTTGVQGGAAWRLTPDLQLDAFVGLDDQREGTIRRVGAGFGMRF